MISAVLKRTFLPLLAALAGVLLLAPAGATLQGLQVGAQTPDFRLNSLSGERNGFTDLRGDKLTIVLFWSTWSRNSETALLRVEELYRRYGSDGLGVISVNANGQTLSSEEKAEIAATTKRLGLSYPILLDDHLQTFRDFGVIALPTLVVLDPDRTIRYEMSGFPLTGVPHVVDFVAATVEGRSLAPEVEQKTGYRPDPKALHFFNMGRKTLKSRRMADMAEMWFKKAIDADEDFLEPRLSLGRFYVSREEFDKAAEQFSNILVREPDNVAALCESAMLLDRKGQHQEAEVLLKKGIQKDDFYTPCYYSLGYIKGREGNLEEALPLFEKALEINHTSPDAYIFKGRMYEERQDMKQAAESYRRALETLLGGPET